MTSRIHTYEGEQLTVRFEPRRCIHAAICVRELPAVFDTARRPWVELAGAAAETVAAVVARCPTGALHAVRRDGEASEPTATVNTLLAVRNGPLYASGRLAVHDRVGALVTADTRAALCRCGATRNAPFCDNSHRAVRFVDPGTVDPGGPIGPALTADTGAAGESPALRLAPLARGPLRVDGPFVLESADRDVRLAGGRASLCRCGASANKPFCDGSHHGVPDFDTP